VPRPPTPLPTLLLAAAALAGCRSAPPPAPRLREWLETSASAYDRQDEALDGVDDGFGVGLGGGYDLVVEGPLRAGFELFGNWSRHDVDDPSGLIENPRLDVWRLGMGGRFSLHPRGGPVGLYVRGGLMYREEEENDVLGVEEDQLARYVGGGLELISNGVAFGPYVLFTEGVEDEREELVVGVSARFLFFDDEPIAAPYPSWR
jgi:hypothetical protein